MKAPRDITHCFAFDKKKRSVDMQRRPVNFFLKLTCGLVFLVFLAQIVFFFL